MDGPWTDRVKKHSPDTKIIALTVHQGEEYVLATLKAGADGYVLKDASYGELVTAMRTVLEDKHYLSPQISGKLIEGYLEGRKSCRRAGPISENLTKTGKEKSCLISPKATFNKGNSLDSSL
jgi:DNA-binding NarL/FixJ family response regulator